MNLPEIKTIRVVDWSDCLGDMDETIDWPFTFGDATYTLVSPNEVIEGVREHLYDIDNRIRAANDDHPSDENRNVLEKLRSEKQATEACIALLKSLPVGVLVAFDG
jgi:hypothetical protein